ncbi:MAG TPA: MBL fold metallo-hydrolase [Longimicrobiales bacterium]
MRIGPFCTALVLGTTSCAPNSAPETPLPPSSIVVGSGGWNRSASYLYRVDDGVIVIDLGWWGARSALERGLRALGATPDDVVAVFLTHTHRDHLGAWRLVRAAPFNLAADEAPLLLGEAHHGGLVPGWTDRILPTDLPGRDDVDVRSFGDDTAFVFGGDTLRAFLVPGHTRGSVAYLFRGRLHVGDAVAHTTLAGYRPALEVYSADMDDARRSVAWLRDRVEPYAVESVCTAHAKCSLATDAFWNDLLED